MKTITANELKTKGIRSIGQALETSGEVIITERGKEKYVVLDLQTYNRLRVCELEAALHETRQEVERGEYVVESVEEHIKRVSKAAE